MTKQKIQLIEIKKQGNRWTLTAVGVPKETVATILKVYEQRLTGQIKRKVTCPAIIN